MMLQTGPGEKGELKTLKSELTALERKIQISLKAPEAEQTKKITVK